MGLDASSCVSFPSSDRTPHTRNWHRIIICHAPIVCRGHVRLPPVTVASRWFSSAEGAGSRTSEQHSSSYCGAAPPFAASAQRSLLPDQLAVDSLSFSWKSPWRVGHVSVSRLCEALSSTSQTRQSRNLPFVGDVQPRSWLMTTPLAIGTRHGSPRSLPLGCRK